MNRSAFEICVAYAASVEDEDLLSDLLSDGVSVFDSDVLSLFDSDVLELSLLAGEAVLPPLPPDFESVMYHPDPLKIMAEGVITRRTPSCPSGQMVRGSSLNF